METLTYNNGNLNIINGNNSNQRPHSNKSRSSNFSQAAVNKSDVGDFQAGYFVMADMPHQPQIKLKNHHNNNNNNYNKIERQEKRNHRPPHQRARSISDLDLDNIDIQLEIKKGGEINVSYGRLPTPPHRSPTRNNKRNSRSPSLTPQSTNMDSNNLTLSPPKARKAPHHERHVDRDREYRESVSHSPPKDKGPSPTPNRWAGPAFSNAPPPSSLPLPDFPPFSLSVSPVSSSPPSSSPLSSSPPESSSASVIHYQEQFFVQPPLYPAPYPHFNAHFSFAEAPAHYGYNPPSLVQLSTDLRRMLNIVSDPVLA